MREPDGGRDETEPTWWCHRRGAAPRHGDGHAHGSGAVDFYLTLPTPRGPAGGWSLAGGTSEATPLLAGIVAIADQAAGHRLGLLNDRLYSTARRDDGGIVDVVGGSNAVTLCLKGCTTATPVLLPVAGYTATRGYDLASGLGTVDAAELVDALRHGDG
jgi:hypothetical protein